MGLGVIFECDCQQTELWLGVGLGFPRVYQETISDVKAGKYGQELKKLYDETELATVDATEEPYYCPNCGKVEGFTCLDLYKPQKPEEAKKVVIGNWSAAEKPSGKTVGELGGWPYWTPPNGHDKGEGDYVLLKEYEHQCPDCHQIMRKLPDNQIGKIKCPKCGKLYSTMEGDLWD